MKLKDWLKRVNPLANNEDVLSNGDVHDLIHYLETAELDCENVFRVLDRFAEIEVRREDAALIFPLVREHINECHDCCDEYTALMEVLERAHPLSEN